MIRINQCKVSVPYTMQDVEKKVSQILHCKSEDIQKIHIVKESLDARKKPALFYSLVLDVACRAEEKLLRNTKSKDVQPAPEKKYQFPVTAGHICPDRPVIIGEKQILTGSGKRVFWIPHPMYSLEKAVQVRSRTES